MTPEVTFPLSKDTTGGREGERENEGERERTREGEREGCEQTLFRAHDTKERRSSGLEVLLVKIKSSLLQSFSPKAQW